MAEPFLGQILWFAPNFAPRGWALCQGQLLPIAQNSALFAILGTTYGGDGRTTFGLPDLRGRVAVHAGTGPGLSSYRLGAKLGVETVQVTTAQLPGHTHAVTESPQVDVVATTDDGNQSTPIATDRLAAVKLPAGINVSLYGSAAPDTTLGGVEISGNPTTQSTGNGQSHDNMQPFLGLHFIIALTGVFPSRN